MALKEMSAQTRECGLSWNAALADVIKVRAEMRASWIRATLSPMTEETQARREGPREDGGRDGVVRLQAEEHRGVLATGRSGAGLGQTLPHVLRRNSCPPHLDFGLLASRAVRGGISVV